jgi:hypothetical protein
MQNALELVTRVLLAVYLVVTLGTLLLVGFAKLCGFFGLMTDKTTGGNIKEFLRNFS